MKKTLVLTLIFSLVLIISCNDEETGLSEEQQLAADIELIDNYLATNNIDAQIHESEIRYVVDIEGDGESPTSESSVIVKYEARYLDGRVFDENDLGVNLGLPNLIEAWKLIVPVMNEGGKITFYAPSKYCYGPRGNAAIPPNTVLVFEVELVSLVRSDSEQLEIDLAIIDEYLAENNIDYVIHGSGIRYHVITEGTGISPTLNDIIEVNYSGQLLGDEEVFDEANNVQFRLSTLISAWRNMLPTMKEGGKIIVYSPSKYCYGNNGDGLIIPPNANLIFEIELVSVQ